MTQLLFKPRDGLHCADFIRYTHFLYCTLLRRYLECKYSPDTAKADLKYESLLAILDQLSDITPLIRQVYLTELESSQISQVLAEIYNLLWYKMRIFKDYQKIHLYTYKMQSIFKFLQ